MANSIDNCTDWQTKVRLYKAGNPGSMQETPGVNIPEKEFCITMPGITPGPLGRPIDANLAVKFINDLYKEANNAYGPADIDNLSCDELKNLYIKARAFISDIINLNYGMTIDKNFALKLLSQPKCEGIRCYLCYKEGETDAKLSLVTVGVDADGFDLNYNKADTINYTKVGSSDTVLLPAINNAPPLIDVVMRSLGGEYVTPPFTIELTDFMEKKQLDEGNSEFQKRFVLLNIATGQKNLLDF